jgi:hypothetical protein
MEALYSAITIIIKETEALSHFRLVLKRALMFFLRHEDRGTAFKMEAYA